jgi:hypothetical protein
MTNKVNGSVVGLPVPFLHILEAGLKRVLDRLIFILHAQSLPCRLQFLE